MLPSCLHPSPSAPSGQTVPAWHGLEDLAAVPWEEAYPEMQVSSLSIYIHFTIEDREADIRVLFPKALPGAPRKGQVTSGRERMS